MSDVRLFQTLDDGDILIENGVTELGGGLETAAYLSMFGGDADEGQWWANISELDPVKKYTSETQQILDTLTPTSGNLLRVEDAVNSDLNWFLTARIASSVSSSVSVPAIGRVKIVINIEAYGQESSFEFTENWKAKT